MLVDAYFSKRTFIEKITNEGFEVISRLRDDAHLRYLYTGEKTGKRGAPKKYTHKVDNKNIDKEYFKLVEEDGDDKIYTAIVNSKSLKMNIKLVYWESKNSKGELIYKLYFSTKTETDAKKIITYYRKRFQIEFIYRDAKQHTGLNDCKARSENKLHFHFNISLTTVNIAKFEHLINMDKYERGAFSMYHNTLLLEKFYGAFAKNRYLIKNKEKIPNLINFGKIVA